jgi:hypothetical protein
MPRFDPSQCNLDFIPMIPLIRGISTYTEFFDYFTDSFSKFCMGMAWIISSLLSIFSDNSSSFVLFKCSGNCCWPTSKIPLAIVQIQTKLHFLCIIAVQLAYRTKLCRQQLLYRTVCDICFRYTHLIQVRSSYTFI